MRKIDIDLGDKSYPIYIGSGLINQQNLIDKHINGKQVMVVSNEIVAPLYMHKLKSLLKSYDVCEVVLTDGEQYKTLASVEVIFNALLEKKFNRNCTLIALGGGVIGDITGFAAASYQRGVSFIQFPTTLLSQVDSSVGGKTGVNHPLGKNMIGAFYQPKCVIIDIDSLDTLNDRQYAAGLAEVIKYGLLGNIDFLTYVEENISKLTNRQADIIIDTVYTSCADKAKIVAADEFEAGNRALLNLGHTFAHAIENILGYGVYLHGEAVAVGMLMALRLSQLHGYLEPKDVLRLNNLLQTSNLPITLNENIDTTEFIAKMMLDKKTINGNINLILLKELGAAFMCDDYQEQLLEQVITEFCA